MPTNYPAAFDDGTTLPTTRVDSTTALTSHPADHDNAAGAILAIEAKLGTGSSAPINGQVLTGGATAGTSSWATPATGTGTSPHLGTGTDTPTWGMVLTGGFTSGTSVWRPTGFGPTIVLTIADVDTTGGADSTSTIQGAINALPVTGGTVTLPVGDMRLNGTLNIGTGSAAAVSTRTGVVLQGGVPLGTYMTQSFARPDGVPNRGVTRLFSGAATPMLNINGPLTGWGIRSLHLDGANLGTYGIVETACEGGRSSDCIISWFTSIQQLTRALDATGPMANVGPNHAQNRYNDFSICLPNINGARGIDCRGNGVTATTDSWGDKWDNLQVQFRPPPSAGVTVYGIYLGAADNQRFHDVTFECGGPTVGTGRFYDIVFDYTSEWRNLPSDCRIDSADFGNSNQTTGINPISYVGTPTGYIPNRIYSNSTANARVPNPNVPGVIYGGDEQYFQSMSGAPTTNDLPFGQYRIYKDSVSGAVKLYVNDGGVIRSGPALV